MRHLACVLLVLTHGCYASHEAGDRPRFDAGSGPDAGPPPVGFDAGPRDAGAPDGCDEACVGEPIRWSFVGGLRMDDRQYELSPCGRVVRAIDRFGGAAPTICVEDVSPAACEPLAALSSALSTPAVAELRAQGMTQIGRDDRASDGDVLLLFFVDALLVVGDDCAGDPACVPVPPEVRVLVGALRVIQAELEAPGRCADEAPGDVFPCGRAQSTISCVTGREVCYLRPSSPPRCEAPDPSMLLCGPPLRCECLPVSFAETCEALGSEQLVVRWTGP